MALNRNFDHQQEMKNEILISVLEENKKLEKKVQHNDALISGILGEHSMFYDFAKHVSNILNFPVNDDNNLLRNNLASILANLKEKMERSAPPPSQQPSSAPTIYQPPRNNLNTGNFHQITINSNIPNHDIKIDVVPNDTNMAGITIVINVSAPSDVRGVLTTTTSQVRSQNLQNDYEKIIGSLF